MMYLSKHALTAVAMTTASDLLTGANAIGFMAAGTMDNHAQTTTSGQSFLSVLPGRNIPCYMPLTRAPQQGSHYQHWQPTPQSKFLAQPLYHPQPLPESHGQKRLVMGNPAGPAPPVAVQPKKDNVRVQYGRPNWEAYYDWKWGPTDHDSWGVTNFIGDAITETPKTCRKVCRGIGTDIQLTYQSACETCRSVRSDIQALYQSVSDSWSTVGLSQGTTTEQDEDPDEEEEDEDEGSCMFSRGANWVRQHIEKRLEEDRRNAAVANEEYREDQQARVRQEKALDEMRKQEAEYFCRTGKSLRGPGWEADMRRQMDAAIRWGVAM